MKNSIFPLACALIALTSSPGFGGPGHAHAEVSASGSDELGGLIKVTEQGKKNLGIEVVEAEVAEIEKTLQAVVEIVPIPSHVAVLSSRIPGKVKEINATSGQNMTAGETMVVIESFQAGDPPPSVSYAAPISGVVTHWDAAVGESVEPNGHLAEIIDLSEVFAEITLFEGQLNQVQLGQTVRVYVESYPGEVFEGKIELMSGKLDPEMRALKVFATLKNPDNKLRPHMRGTGYIVTEKLDAVIGIPHRAVTGDPGRLFAFVQTDEAGLQYEQRNVVVGSQDDRITEIIEGVLPGEMVVVSGNYQLQFVKDRSAIAAGGGHGHAHGPGGEHLTEEAKAAHGETDESEEPDETDAPEAVSLWSQITESPLIQILGIGLLLSLIANGILLFRKTSS